MIDGNARSGGTMMRTVSALVGGLIGWTIRAYQLLVAPVLPASCRYHPSCSEYARQAIAGHGPLAGGWLALGRIGRCHPWGGSGVDPVPPAAGHATRPRRRRRAARHG
jgi:putative membrane protein insertion efficiency factor